MEISSREELVNLLNNKAIETHIIESRPGVKIMQSIIYDKIKDAHYRIEWGEIADEKNIYHLWYKKEVDKVFLNRTSNKEGWCAKNEFNINVESGVDLSEHKFYRIEKNIVKGDCIIDNSYNLENITMWGTKAGKGKTSYAIIKSVEKMISGKNVLFFSTEETQQEVARRFIRTIEHLGKDPKELLNNVTLKIVSNYLMDTNYIISKVEEEVAMNNNSPFVVIDHLNLSNKDNKNYKEIVNIHNVLDYKAIELNCEMLITTQLNSGL